MSDKVTKCFAEICMTNEACAEAAEARVAELERDKKVISRLGYKMGAVDMRKRIAAVICPFCNKGVPISEGGRHLGIECFAIEVWTLPLDGGDGE